MNDDNPRLHAARAYLARGWPVFPVAWPEWRNGWHCSCVRGPDCQRAAKHPVARLAPHGLRDASRDPRVIAEWWRQCPRASVGVVLGEVAGVWVLDVDARSGGLETLASLERDRGPLPATLRATTGGGGLHFVFLWPGRRVPPRSHLLGPGVDVRGDGSYIVAAPSLHVSGQRYRWTYTCDSIAHAPAWLAEAVMVAPPAAAPPLPAPEATRAGLAGVERARRYLRRLPPAVSGQGGHGTTFRAALALVRGFELPEADALSLLAAEYNPRCDPPWSLGELVHKVESAARARVAPGYLLRAPR